MSWFLEEDSAEFKARICEARRSQTTDWRRRTSGALDVVLQDDVGEGEDEVQHDDDGDEDAPLLERVPAERRCAADASTASDSGRRQ